MFVVYIYNILIVGPNFVASIIYLHLHQLRPVNGFHTTDTDWQSEYGDNKYTDISPHICTVPAVLASFVPAKRRSKVLRISTVAAILLSIAL